MADFWVSPIPKNRPDPPEHRLGKPAGFYIYQDPEGHPSYVLYRWDTATGKEYRPLSLWQKEGGQLFWKWSYPPSPRPLWGLDALARTAGATVLVVEGEKTAIAAQALFPDLAVVTSGSATSASSADWSPLRESKVIHCPDADEPGRRYAHDVGEGLQGVAESFAVVQIPVEFPEGWDLADPLPEGWDVVRLRILLEAAQKRQVIVGPMPRAEGGPRNALRILSAGEVLNAPVKPREWLWQGYIPLGREGLVGGLSDVGKTAFHLQLAVAVTTGRDLFGIPTRSDGEGVLFLTYEDDPSEDFRERLAWVKETYPDWGPEDDAMLERNLKLASPTWEASASIMAIREEIETCFTEMQSQGAQPALLILETLASITEGDGNSDESTRQVWATARAMRTKLGVTVSLAHHHKKPTTEESRDAMAQLEARQLRGTSNNEGSARWVIQLGAIHFEKAEALGLDPAKAQRRGYVVLANSKVKADPPPPLFLERIDANMPGRHTWARRLDGDRIIADLMKSKRRREELGKQEKVGMAVLRLGDLATRESVLNHTALSVRELDSAISELRKKLFLGKQRSPYLLTPTGLDWARQIARTQVPEFNETIDPIGLCLGYSDVTQVGTQVPELRDRGNSHTQVPLGVGPELSSEEFIA